VSDRSARVTLYSRPGCHLCDDARVVVERVCADLGESYEEVDITTSDDLLRRFQIEIPVTFVDGEQLEVHWVSEDRLRRALTR
jgi:glutaredoxin